MPGPDLTDIRNQVRRTAEGAQRDVREPLKSIDEALSEMIEDDNEPRPQRLHSINEELEGLAENADDTTADRIRPIREDIREFLEG